MQTTFDFSKTEQYNLSIRLASDGFSFYIVDPVNDGKAIYKFYPLSKNKSQLSQLEDLFYSHEQLLLPYRKTEVIVNSSNYTLVPNELFKTDQKDQFLSFQFQNSGGKLLSNNLRRLPVTNVFSLDEGIYSFLQRSLSPHRIIHYITPLAEYFAERSKFGNYSKMYVHIEVQKVDLFCFERNRLKLNNTIPFHKIGDAAYYVLNAWENTGLSQTDDELHVTGDGVLRSELMPYLTKYVQRVLPLNPPTGWYVEPVNHEYLPVDLMTISLCE